MPDRTRSKAIPESKLWRCRDCDWRGVLPWLHEADTQDEFYPAGHNTVCPPPEKT